MSIRWQTAETRDRGFTLVELLIVIVILGILATVAVVAVQGIPGTAEAAAGDSDQRALINAQESYRTQNGSYTTEAELVAAGFLRSESARHDIALNGDGSYDIVPTDG